jgi:hypothetical protein
LVRAAICPGRARFVGTSVDVIHEPITVAIRLTRGRTTIAFQGPGLIGACILEIRKAVIIPIWAAPSERPANLVRTKVVVVEHAITIAVCYLDGFHIDRGAGPAAAGIKGSGRQRMVTS